MDNIYYNLLNDDRAIIAIEGEDRQSFLQAITSNDINKLPCYSLLLSPQGKYLFDFFIIEENDRYLLDINKATKKNLIAKLSVYKLRSKVTIIDYSEQYQILSITGDNLPIGKLCYRDPRHNLMGARMIVKKDQVIEFTPNIKSYDQLRIECGISEGERDLIADKAFPLEYGLDKLNAIDYHKGCYVGQEVTARTKHRGVVRKTIYKISSEENLPPKDNEIFIGDKKIGTMCSAFNHQGLALIRIEDYEQVKDLPHNFALSLPEWNKL